MVRLAIVSYFAPPQPAVASHRVLRLTRALLRAGHQVDWVTQSGEELLARDESLAGLIPPAVRIHGLGGPTVWSRPVARSLLEKGLRTLAFHLPRWFALPDPHLGWTWRLRRALPGLLARAGVEAVLFCCGPHGQILAVPALRRLFPDLRIFLDYRDLLSGNTWTAAPRAGVRRRLLARERRVLALVDGLFVNTSEARTRFLAVVGDLPGLPVAVMRNAADYELAEEVAHAGPPATPGPGVHLGFFGTLFPRRRLTPVLTALGRLKEEQLTRISLHCYTDPYESARLLAADCRAAGEAVAARVHRHDLLPFGAALRTMRTCHAQVLVNGPGEEDNVFVPGKLFDYLMARRPVLFVGRPGDAWRIVAATSGADWCLPHDEPEGLAARLAGLVDHRPPDLAPALEFGPERTFAPLLDALAERRP